MTFVHKQNFSNSYFAYILVPQEYHKARIIMAKNRSQLFRLLKLKNFLTEIKSWLPKISEHFQRKKISYVLAAA